MGRAVPIQRPADLRAVLRNVVLTLMALGSALVVAAVTVQAPALLRLVTWLAVTFALSMLVLHRPRAGVLATITFLVFMQLTRRLLIEPAGWASFDPLLLTGPAVVGVLCVQQFTLRRAKLAPDLLSKLVLAVLVLTVLEIPNPISGGPAAGLTGFLFTGFPLLWFFVGRELCDARFTSALLGLLVALGTVTGLYGLAQSTLGYLPWDQAWFDVTGYNSLNVGDELRAFATFASSAEYALFIGSAIAVAFVFAIQGRTAVGLLIPPLVAALFLSATRGALVTAFTAMVVCGAVATRRAVLAAVLVVVAFGGAFGALNVFGDSLSRSASNSGSDRTERTVGGLTDPLNSESSTLITHLTLVVEGVRSAAGQPLGRGPGASNQGATLTSGGKGTQSTEVDLSNAFVNLGLAGGFLYLGVFFLALAWCVRGYFRGADHLLGVLAVLIVGAGQWLTGGHYALSPFTWLCIGAIAAAAHAQGQRQQSRVVPPRSQELVRA